MPDLNMYTNSWLNFHPHYVTTIGMYLHRTITTISSCSCSRHYSYCISSNRYRILVCVLMIYILYIIINQGGATSRISLLYVNVIILCPPPPIVHKHNVYTTLAALLWGCQGLYMLCAWHPIVNVHNSVCWILSGLKLGFLVCWKSANNSNAMI